MVDKFLNELKEELIKLNSEDIDDTIDYFTELINDKRNEGFKDEEIIKGLDSPLNIALSLNKDNFSNELVDIEKEDVDFRCHKDEVSEINLENAYLNVKFIKAGDDYISIKYPDKFKYNIEHDYNELNIEFDNNPIIKKGNITKLDELVISLPNIDNLEINIDNVLGEINISDMLFNELNIDDVSGNIIIEDSKIKELNIDVVSGDITISDVSMNELNIDAISSNIKTYDIVSNYIDIDTISGNVNLNIKANKEEYNIKVDSLKKSYEYHREVSSSKEINIDSVSGKIEYSFD